jgi:hypothetical protein
MPDALDLLAPGAVSVDGNAGLHVLVRHDRQGLIGVCGECEANDRGRQD